MRLRALIRRHWPCLVPLAFLAALLHPALSPGALLMRRDALLLSLPLKQFLAQELSALRFPTWYPLDGLGVSYVGTSSPGAFHPLNLLYLLLEPDQGLKWQTLLCFPVAALGAYLLARRLGASRAGRVLAALGFSASGYLLSVANNLPYLQTAAVLPFSLLAAERVARRPDPRSGALLALALLMALVGGDVQGFLLQAVAAVTVVAFARPPARGRRRLARLRATLFAAGLGALAALPLLLPVWATFRGSARGQEGLSLAAAQAWSFHPLRLLELAIGPLLPKVMRMEVEPVTAALGGARGSFWAYAELVGLPICALAAAALLRRLPRRLRLHAALGAAALVLALGADGLLYPLFHRALPLWSAFRYPEKLMPFAVLSLCLLAAWGLRRLVRADRRVRILLGALLLLLVALTMAASPSVVRAWLAPRLAAADLSTAEAGLAEISRTIRSHALLGLGLAGVLSLLAVRGGRAAAWGAVALNAVQVGLLSGWVVGVMPREQWLAKDSPFRAPVQAALASGDAARLCWDVQDADYAREPAGAATEELRVLDTVARTLGPATRTLWGVPDARQYGPGGDGPFAAACGARLRCPSDCARVAGAGLGLIDEEQFAALPEQQRAGLEVLARDDAPRAVLFRDRLARPLASLPAVRRVPPGELRAAVYSPGRRPRDEALLAGDGPELPAAPGGSVQARWERPDRMVAAAEVPGPALAVLAVSCERGWRARVDGEPAPLERADGSLCAVWLPAGRHEVRLDFVPSGWPWAFAGPAAIALAGLACLARRIARRARRPRAAEVKGAGQAARPPDDAGGAEAA